ncbi:MAG: diguanylate cyclase, partial [Acidaminobacteraceae bacterium]
MFLYLICSIIYVFIGLVIYFNNKRSRLNQTFLGICMLLFLWTFFLALMSATKDASVATLFRVLSVFSWGTLYSLLLLFIIFLTENSKYLKTKLHYIVIFLPTFMSYYLYILDPVTIDHIVKIDIGWAFLNPTDKSFLWNVFFNTYYSIYMIIVLILLIRWYRKTNIKRHKEQAKIIIVTMFLTFILGSLTDVIFPIVGIELMPPITVFIALSIIFAIAYSMLKFGLMVITNEKVVSDVFEIMNEGLIILDHDYNINGINEGALNMIGYNKKDLLYNSIEMLFDHDDIISKLNHSSSSELNILMKSKDCLPILASTSILLDNFGDRLGNLLIFQDLSSYKKIQSELEEAYDDLELKVRDRTHELTHVNTQLGIEIDMRIEKEARIRDLAYNDQLTGLPNRKSFNKHLDNTIKKSKKNNSIFAVLFLDLDRFKMINDTLGHDQGDFLLEKVATRLKLLFGEGDYLARVGGDEFIVLIDNLSSVKDAQNICGMILKSFNYPFNLNIGDIYTTTSIGVAMFPSGGVDSKA